jgi:hypothetical protein
MDSTLFHRLCYIFPACGMTDLRVGVCKPTAPPPSIFFMQTVSPHPFPRNGFFAVDADTNRFRTNMETHDRVVANQPIVGLIPAPIVEAFLSLANCDRAFLEQGMTTTAPSNFNRARRLYVNGLLLTRDVPAARMLDLINKRAHSVTFCSADNSLDALLPLSLLALVAECFAGLAIVSYHQGMTCQSIGFATVSLSKHPCALPFVNCVRLFALARHDLTMVLMLTEMVILPYYLRSTDPSVRKLYDTELSVWDPCIRARLEQLPAQLVATSVSMAKRFAGHCGVVRAKFIDDRFVEKICAVCGKGGKLSRCGLCGKVYYCGKDCQLAGWKAHKRAGCSGK